MILSGKVGNQRIQFTVLSIQDYFLPVVYQNFNKR